MNITPELMLEFIKIYYAPEFLPCDLGAEEMFEAEFYLNLADFTDERTTKK